MAKKTTLPQKKVHRKSIEKEIETKQNSGNLKKNKVPSFKWTTVYTVICTAILFSIAGYESALFIHKDKLSLSPIRYEQSVRTSAKTEIQKQTLKKQVRERKREQKAPIVFEKIGPFSRTQRKQIFDIINQTIADGLAGKSKVYPDLSKFPPKWSEKRGVYVTLNIDGKLRGCRGTQKPEKPFLHALVDSTYNAAFDDSRFSKLTVAEFKNPQFSSYVSILSPFQELSFSNEKDLIKKIKPFKYGMMLTDKLPNGKSVRGLFLPSVWKKRPDPENFWTGLKKKAKLKENYWSDTLKVEYFSVEDIRDLNVIDKQDSKRIDIAISALQNMFMDNGRVIYEVDFKDGKPSKDNNLVREMGTGYGLAYGYYMTKDAKLKPILERFMKYAQSISKIEDKKAFIADENGKIKSGATSLALLAGIYYEQASRDKSFALLRQQWANGLVSLFEKNVGIHTSPTNTKTSPYYDGEAWLALSVYDEFFPEDKNIDAIMKDLDETMNKKYYEKYLYNFFHWGTQAAAKQFAKNKDELMHKYLQHQLKLYIDGQAIYAKFASCSYMEALSEAALAIQQTDPELYQQVVERIEDQLEVARLLQQTSPTIGKNDKIAAGTEKFIGLFLQEPKKYKTRNDVTQHCLISLLKAREVLRQFK